MADAPGGQTSGAGPVGQDVNPYLDNGGTASSGTMSYEEALALARFYGLPDAMANDPTTLWRLIGLGAVNPPARGGGGSAGEMLNAQANMLQAQAQAEHFKAQDAIAKGQLELAKLHEANATRLDELRIHVQQQATEIAAQMDYAKGLMSLSEKPENAYGYEFSRYGLQTPQGGTAVPGLPVPDVVKKLFAQQTPGNPTDVINPTLTGAIPGAVMNPQGVLQGSPGAGGAQGTPAGYTGQMLTLSPYLQNLFNEAGHPTSGIPVGQPPPGYKYPSIGTPSAQSLRLLSPDQMGNLTGYARDINGQPAAALQSSIEKLSPQGGGLSTPSDFTGAASGNTAEAFGTGGLVLHPTRLLAGERGVPEQLTPRPDLAGMEGQPNIHGALGSAGGAIGPALAAALAAMHGGLHGAPLPSLAGAPGGSPLAPLPPGPSGPPAGAGAPLSLGAGPTPPAGPLGLPGTVGAPGGGLAGGPMGANALPPPPGPQAGLMGAPLPPMSPQIAAMQMPSSRETGPNPTTPIVPKVPIPEGPLGPNSTGPQVTALQRALERMGYFHLPFGANYGTYGPATTEAVRRFQQDHGHAPAVGGTHDKQTAQLMRQRLTGYGSQPHGPNRGSMRGADQHPMPAGGY